MKIKISKILILHLFLYNILLADCSTTKYKHLFNAPNFIVKNPNIEKICYETHIVYFDKKMRVPLLVEYKISKDNISDIKKGQSIKRSSVPFKVEKNRKNILEEEQYHPNEYIGQGVDRGHLLPYNNAGKDKDEKQDINKMTNIAPQNRGLNRGCWRVKETNLLKDFEKSKKDIVITVGISFPKDEKDLEKVGDLNYPKSFFMFIIDEDKKKTIYQYPNIKPQKGTCNNSIYIDIDEKDLEDEIGIDIYPSI